MRKRKKNTVVNILNEHINNNKIDYFIIILIFFIGLILGIFFLNNSDINQINEIDLYMQDIINILKENQDVNKIDYFIKLCRDNLFLALLLWFMGSTVIGIIAVYFIIGIQGFCLGYTISAIISVLGMKNGIIFSLLSLFVQNILFIPAIFALAISGIKLYKSIMKDKRKENIKIEILRHTIFSAIVSTLLIVSAFLETYISNFFIQNYINFL